MLRIYRRAYYRFYRFSEFFSNKVSRYGFDDSEVVAAFLLALFQLQLLFLGYVVLAYFEQSSVSVLVLGLGKYFEVIAAAILLMLNWWVFLRNAQWKGIIEGYSNSGKFYSPTFDVVIDILLCLSIIVTFALAVFTDLHKNV